MGDRYTGEDAAGPEHVDGVWERMRTEERAYQLERVVQDAVRDARVADLLAAPCCAER
ncbi:hypothetical protein ACXR2U_00155 [Jatrophihabitans sp. YIM 134969]